MAPFAHMGTRRGMIGALIALCLCFAPYLQVCPASARPCLEAEKAADVLNSLRAGAGKITAFHANFVQTQAVPDLPAPLLAHGTISFRAPNSLRWVYLGPVRSGGMLNGNTSAFWSDAGGQHRKTGPRESSRAGEIARLAIAFLAFDEETLRARCDLNVLSAQPPTLLLTPKNDVIRAFIPEITLAFSRDGSVPHSLRILTARGGDCLFTFSGIVRSERALNRDELEALPETEPKPLSPPWVSDGVGTLFSVSLTENGRHLPLLLYAYDTGRTGAGRGEVAIKGIVLTEMLLHIGSVDVTPGRVSPVPGVPDAKADEVLIRVGQAVQRLFPEGVVEPFPPALRYSGKGWTVSITALSAKPVLSKPRYESGEKPRAPQGLASP